MTGAGLLQDLGLLLVAALVILMAGRAVRAPSIVAYLLAGLVLGPLTGLLAVSEAVELLGEAGIVLLLFLVGLELSFEKIRTVGPVALAAGSVQVLLTAAGGFGLCLLLGLETRTAAFMAVALTFSSTVVAVKLLAQKRALDSVHGRIAIGILLVQDVAVIVALTLVAGLGTADGVAAPQEPVAGLITAFAGMLLLVAAALASARWLLPRAFGWASRSPDVLFMWSLAWCFAFIVGSELLHLSVEVGGFLAGVSLAQLPYNHELRRRVRPLTSFFLAVFFVALGAGMDLSAASTLWPHALALSAFVLLGKPLLVGWLVRRGGRPAGTAFRAGVTLGQISEFSFILAGSAVAGGLLDPTALSLVGLVGLITLSTSAYAILYDERLRALVGRWLPAVAGEEEARGAGRRAAAEGAEDLAPLRDHVIVVGMNHLGRGLVRALCARGQRVLAIDTDPAKLHGLPCRTLLGNATDPALVEDAAFAEARLVVSALQIEDANRLLAWRCRRLGVACSIHAFDRSVVSELERLEPDHLIVSKNAGLRGIVEELKRRGLLGSGAEGTA